MSQNNFDEIIDAGHLGAVGIANHLLTSFGAAKRTISSIQECDDVFFVALYEAVTGEPLEGVIKHDASKDVRAQNCQIVIDALSRDVLQTDLSHINGKDIVNGNISTVGNLLEIFYGLLEYIYEDLQQEEMNKEDGADQQEEQDSNILSEDHEILSDVMQKEFGESLKKNEEANKSRNSDDQQRAKFVEHGSIKEQSKKDTDSESQSSLDFTQDSLYNTGGRKTVIRNSKANMERQMPPFAYFSSSSSNSTEELTREAENYQLNSERQHRLSLNSSSTTRQHSRSSKEPNKSTDQPKLTDYLPRATSEKKTAAATSMKSSTSSTHWPSTLSPNELNTSNVNRVSGYELSGKRPKAPFSADVDSCSEKSTGSSASVVHKHTHHHFYHYDNNKSYSKQNVSKSRDDKSESKKPQLRSLLRETKHSDLQLNSLAEYKARMSVKSKGSGTNEDFGIAEHSIISSSLLADVDERPIKLPKERNLFDAKGQRSQTSFLENKKENGATPSRGNIAGNSGVLVQKKNVSVGTSAIEGNRKKNQADFAPHVRSVQTSVSDMPVNEEQQSALDKGEQTSSLDSSGSKYHKPNRSVQSSVSELNDLLNKQGDDKDLNDRTRYDVLEELEKRLEEVRESVKDFNAAQKPNATDENIKSLRDFLEKDARKSYINVDDHNFPKQRTDSTCSDSEFDYGAVYRSSRTRTARKPYRNQTIRGKNNKQSNFENSSASSDDDRDEVEQIKQRKKKVKFKDTGRESRDERLERLIKVLKSEENENESELKKVKQQYGKNLRAAKERKEQLCGPTKEENTGRNSLLHTTPNRSASRLARIYGSQSRKASKPRKRSASSSPVPRARRKGRLIIEEEDILPMMEDVFPHLYLSPATAKMMWQKQMDQISTLTRAARPRKPTRIQKQIEDAKRKQDALMNIMKKELDHNKRMREQKEKVRQQMQVRTKLRDRRLASARARRYYDEYQVRSRARMLKRRTKEEKIFKQLFEDALEIQKQRVRELREYAKEQREIDSQKRQNELESMENYYRDQFAMMAESLARERYELQIRQKSQNKVVENMKKGMRQRMESDIKTLQEELARDEDSAYFRQLDADTLKKEFQLATYKIRM